MERSAGQSSPPVYYVGVLHRDGLPAPFMLAHYAHADAIARREGFALIVHVADDPESRMDNCDMGSEEADV